MKCFGHLSRRQWQHQQWSKSINLGLCDWEMGFDFPVSIFFTSSILSCTCSSSPLLFLNKRHWKNGKCCILSIVVFFLPELPVTKYEFEKKINYLWSTTFFSCAPPGAVDISQKIQIDSSRLLYSFLCRIKSAALVMSWKERHEMILLNRRGRNRSGYLIR